MYMSMATLRVLVLGAVATMSVAGLGRALANTNTGTGLQGIAGTSSAAISGYDITASEYTLNASDPTKTDAIVITYDGSGGVPAKIRVSPTGAGGTFYYSEATGPHTGAGNVCSANATTITCLTTGAGGGHVGTVAEVTNLTIVLTP